MTHTELSQPCVTNAEKSSFDVVEEARLLFSIAIPTVATQFSIYFIYPMTASSVGLTLGTEELASFSLASLTGNLACLSIVMGVLTAADTLMPRAFGAKRYEEIGRLAVRGLAVCCLILIVPFVLLVGFMEPIFEKLGQDLFVSMLASIWLRIYVVGVPFVVLFRIVQRFLAAQHIVHPMVYSAALGCFVVHPILLHFIVPPLGFEGSALALVLTQGCQLLLVLAYLKRNPVYHPRSFQKLSWSFIRSSCKLEPMTQFLKLSLGGVLSMTEWWFWETVCFIAGHLGVIPLCVHTIAYNIIPVSFMIPLGLGIGLSVRMGHVLATDVQGAKYMAKLCMGFTFALGCTLALTLYNWREPVVALFTTDAQVRRGCEEIWPKLCIYIVLLYIFGINSAIMRALGLQWKLAGVICLILWCTTLPTIVHVTVYKGGGINSIWTILPCFYFLMNVLLAIIYTTADWQKISEGIRVRASLEKELSLERHTQMEEATETTGLMVSQTII